MNSIEQKIEVIDATIKGHEQAIKDLQQSIYDLNDQHQKLMIQFVRERKLLHGTKWRVSTARMSYDAGTSLIPYGSIAASEIKTKIKLLRTNYHCSVELQEGIFLRFDDSDTCLLFQSSSLVIPFIQEYEIVVMSLDIRDKIDRMKQDIAAMEEVLKMVGVINA